MSSSNSTPIRVSIPRGAPCACGVGESTCLRCGICRKCSLFTSTSGQTSSQPHADEEQQAMAGEEPTSDTDNEPADKPIVSNVPKFTTNPVSTEAVLMPGRVVLSKPNNDIKGKKRLVIFTKTHLFSCIRLGW